MTDFSVLVMTTSRAHHDIPIAGPADATFKAFGGWKQKFMGWRYSKGMIQFEVYLREKAVFNDDPSLYLQYMTDHYCSNGTFPEES